MKTNLKVIFFILPAIVSLLSCQSTPPPEPLNYGAFTDQVLADCVRRLDEQDVAKIKSLGCWHTGVTDLSGIEQLVNLNSLGVTSHHINDLTPLTKLTKLRELGIGAGNIDELDIDALREALPRCEIEIYNYFPIYLGEVEFADPPMAGIILDQMKQETMIGSKEAATYWKSRASETDDPMFILKLQDVLEIHLDLDGVSRLSGLERLSNLGSLYIKEKSIDDIEVVERLPKLTSLDITVGNIDEEYVAHLKATCPNIRYIHLHEFYPLASDVVKDPALVKIIEEANGMPANRITMDTVLNLLKLNNDVKSLEGLEYATKLKTFAFSKGTDQDLSPLSHCTEIMDFYLTGCSFTDLSVLKDLSPRKIVISGHHGEMDLSVLNNTKGLTTLTIRNCNLTDIDFLEGLTSLRNLDLGNNNLSDVSSIASLTNLETLNLEDNNLDSNDLLSIVWAVKLDNLNLKNNNISSYQAIVPMPNLRHLNIEGNPNTSRMDKDLIALTSNGVQVIGKTN